MKTLRFQIGKNGISEGVINSLVLAFKNHKVVRISLLQASGRNKAKTISFADEIARTLENKTSYLFKYTIIGFTVVLRRYSK